MTNPLLEVIGELKREEQAKKKKRKPVLALPKEKRLQYYSGWGKGKRDEETVEKQRKLR